MFKRFQTISVYIDDLIMHSAYFDWKFDYLFFQNKSLPYIDLSVLFVSHRPTLAQVDIFAQLQNASEAFRTYIRDGLAQV